MTTIGIMLGRLSIAPGGRLQVFPAATWREEFAAARAGGFGAIEWLVTADGIDDNPIWTDAGLAEMRARAADHRLRLVSVCADCFITQSFVRVATETRRRHSETLTRLVERCASAGIPVIGVPVLESAALITPQDADDLLQALTEPLALAEQLGVRIALESDWDGAALAALIERSASPALGVYYDVGNATALGHEPVRDLARLGPRLYGVHIKDRMRGGGSVPLGDGDVSFASFFTALAGTGYAGPLILETPAGPAPAEMARRNLAHVEAQLAAVGGHATR